MRRCLVSLTVLASGLAGCSNDSSSQLVGTAPPAVTSTIATPTSTTGSPAIVATTEAVTQTTVALSSDTQAVPGVVPAHGIAYSTTSGVVVAGVDGAVVFELDGWRVSDRSLDVSRMAAVVSRGPIGGPVGTEYALILGKASMAQVASVPGPSSVPGWQATAPVSGCLRDGRRPSSRLLLCALTGSGLPREIHRAAEGASSDKLAGAPPVVAPGSGHWVDAIEGPGGVVAATWSGDCESLSAYRVGADGNLVSLATGESTVLGWIDSDVLLARYGGCGPANPDDGVYRVAPDNSMTRIPIAGAIDTPVAW